MQGDKQYKKLVMNHLLKKVQEERSIETISIGFLRYESLRKRNLLELETIITRNMNGELFDDIIDEYVIKDFGV